MILTLTKEDIAIVRAGRQCNVKDDPWVVGIIERFIRN